jgi:NADPH2 dehydrogenase
VQAVTNAVGADWTAIRLSPFNTIHDADGVRLFDPLPRFSDIVSSLLPLKLAYLHLVESLEEGKTINGLMEIWGKNSPILVAGGLVKYSLVKENDPEKAREREAKYPGNDIVVVYGSYFIANPDLPFRMEKGRELTDYVPFNPSFYTPESKAGYTDYAFSKEFERETSNRSVSNNLYRKENTILHRRLYPAVSLALHHT